MRTVLPERPEMVHPFGTVAAAPVGVVILGAAGGVASVNGQHGKKLADVYKMCTKNSLAIFS
jgi:hypothetical protein